MRTTAMLAAWLVVTWGFASCSPSDHSLQWDIADTATLDSDQRGDTGGGMCSGLIEDECKASESCSVIEGWSMPQACLVWQDRRPVIQPQFAACRDAGERACPAAFAWAHPADQPDEVWLFSNLCLPDAWVELDGDPCCAPACDGKECGNDGCGGNCGGCGASQVCNQNLGLCEADSCWPDCGDAVHIPAGSFRMGCNEGVDTQCNADEYPYHEVYLSAYYIDHTEVTVDAYSACVAAGVCTVPSTSSLRCNWGVDGKGSHPVNCLTWYQADEFCAWAGKRLPTEAEWEKAARGADGRKYPWGNEPATCDYAVMNDGGDGCGTNSTWPVCSRSPAGDSPYGVCDMGGNVWEWVADRYDSGYYETSPENDPQGPNSGSARVLRGGGFPDGGACYDYLRLSRRSGGSPHYDGYHLGFRCGRSE